MARSQAVITPSIVTVCDMNLVRCDASGTADTKGLYVKIAKIKLTMDSTYSASTYIQKAELSYGTTVKDITAYRADMCGSAGYTESSPIIFRSVVFDADTNYTFTLRITPATSARTGFQQKFVLNRAKCIMDLSPNGGVGIGTFVSNGSGRPDPRFEVAQTHTAYFLGGIDGVTNYKIGVSEATGGSLNSWPIYRYVCQLQAQTANSQKSYSFAGFLGSRSGGTPLSLRGLAVRDNGSIVPLPFIASDTGQNIVMVINASYELTIATGNSGITSGFVIIEYYKAIP